MSRVATHPGAAERLYPDIRGSGGYVRLPPPSGPLCRCGHPRDNGGHCGHEGEGECTADDCGCETYRQAAPAGRSGRKHR